MKINRKIDLIITIADLNQFIAKNKSITYTTAFFKPYI